MDVQPSSNPEQMTLPGGRVVPMSALRFTAVRSSGPGGQNVNKTATKVQLRIELSDLAPVLGPAALARLAEQAKSQITAAGELLLSCDESRSQHANRSACLARLRTMLVASLRAPRVRKRTRPTRSSKARRLDAKQQRSQRKRDRGASPERW